ncbi:MAG: hypothetical protein HY903_21185 [Deltaproteobacteria bacterium]|nr:hypothetical protein [Deltaproteobacteria bacterium]
MRPTRAVWLVMAMSVIGACSTDTDTTHQPLFDNGVNVFEAQVIDGQVGAVITNATITIQVGRHLMQANNDNGFYSVYGIPYGTFRILVSAPGYNDFQAMKAFTAAGQFASLANGDPMVYYFNNVLMYPLGHAPGDVKVSVYDSRDGAAVRGATVAATLSQVTQLINLTDVLLPTIGYTPSTMVATTDADGKVSFASANLIMGATYDVDVFGALDADGVYLVPDTASQVKVGYALQDLVVFLDRPVLVPVAVMTNNEDNTLLVSELVVTFPYAVEICNAATNHTWSNTTDNHGAPFSDDTDGDGVFAAMAPTNPVGAALSVNDTVLTMTYAAQNDDVGDDLWVTFSGLTVKPRGASDSSCTSLTSVKLRTITGGATIDTEIHVRDVP